ncbi:epsilon-sarcoglycan [Adelges cooleyi]|uniref:epsilon-sarcoglycan n=1 Tax=Adelges cooleyi TaxID=133065 RepID=UPI00217F6F93|nr:epsilon-sarcoglycan [Adelges cooleyi]
MCYFSVPSWLLIIIVIPASMNVAGRESTALVKNINETETFYYEIRPELFNWTNGIDGNKFSYTPSLHNYPDLPPWIRYKSNDKNGYGYIYGTPPVTPELLQFQLDIVGQNKKTYHVVTKVIQLNIFKKLDIAKYEVRLKINNLNVEDMFEEDRIKSLLDIFRQNLWLESQPNLYVTFLASASDLGQRMPLDPRDQEGVIVNIGCAANFSSSLYDLEKEISPLHKMNKCPKDFKRTSVERYFRANSFNLDWCSFRLVPLYSEYYDQASSTENKVNRNGHVEENNNWELMESLPSSWIANTVVTNVFNISLIAFAIVLLGILSSICILKWYSNEKLNTFKNVILCKEINN